MPMLMPQGAYSQPLLARVVAQNGSQQVIPSGATTTVTGWTTIFDTLGAFTPATGLFVAPAAGFYQIDCALVTLGIPANSNVYPCILVNGVAQLQTAYSTPVGAAVTNGAPSIHGIVGVSLNDVIKIGITQFTGGNVTLFSAAVDSYLTIAQLP